MPRRSRVVLFLGFGFQDPRNGFPHCHASHTRAINARVTHIECTPADMKKFRWSHKVIIELEHLNLSIHKLVPILNGLERYHCNKWRLREAKSVRIIRAQGG